MQNYSQWKVISTLKILFCIENIWRRMFQKYFWTFKMASQRRTLGWCKNGKLVEWMNSTSLQPFNSISADRLRECKNGWLAFAWAAQFLCILSYPLISNVHSERFYTHSTTHPCVSPLCLTCKAPTPDFLLSCCWLVQLQDLQCGSRIRQGYPEHEEILQVWSCCRIYQAVQAGEETVSDQLLEKGLPSQIRVTVVTMLSE